MKKESDNIKLSSLVIKIDKELHKQLKATCAINDISIREYVIEAIQDKLKKEKGIIRHEEKN